MLTARICDVEACTDTGSQNLMVIMAEKFAFFKGTESRDINSGIIVKLCQELKNYCNFNM
jgi:hypothetical protein